METFFYNCPYSKCQALYNLTPMNRSTVMTAFTSLYFLSLVKRQACNRGQGHVKGAPWKVHSQPQTSRQKIKITKSSGRCFLKPFGFRLLAMFTRDSILPTRLTFLGVQSLQQLGCLPLQSIDPLYILDVTSLSTSLTHGRLHIREGPLDASC